MTSSRWSVKEVIGLAGLVVLLGVTVAIAIEVVAGPGPLPAAVSTPPPYPTQSPPPTPSDPSAFLNAAVQLAGDNAEAAVERAVATARSDDATAWATREATVIDRAARAVQLTMVPVAPRSTKPATVPPCPAGYGIVCEPPPRPTETPPWCLDGNVYQNGKYVCRDDATPTATATAAPPPRRMSAGRRSGKASGAGRSGRGRTHRSGSEETGMSEPIRDIEELGRRMYEQELLMHGEPPDWEREPKWRRQEFATIAEIVQSAVCPPGFVVVPKAEHDKLMEALAVCYESWWFGPGAREALDDYLAALAPEPTDG